jgi:hypothetical protein
VGDGILPAGAGAITGHIGIIEQGRDGSGSRAELIDQNQTDAGIEDQDNQTKDEDT